ncbi:MAG: 2'-5' RNA ligase family protein [Kineosporiaceae bacterium]
MGHSVEALLDATTQAWVRAQWDALEAAGVPGQARHTGASNRPHVTFAWAQGVPHGVEASLRATVAELGDAVHVAVRLGGLVVFPRRGGCVLARLVVADAALLELHREIVEACAGAVGLDRHVLPGAWTPHVTLSRKVPQADLGLAVAAVEGVGPLPEAASSRLSGLRRWDRTAKEEWALP